jgi:hypothetical protein
MSFTQFALISTQVWAAAMLLASDSKVDKLSVRIVFYLWFLISFVSWVTQK